MWVSVGAELPGASAIPEGLTMPDPEMSVELTSAPAFVVSTIRKSVWLTR